MTEIENIEFDGDDIWISGDLIARCPFKGTWTVFLDNDVQKVFETLEQAVAFCLEQSHE